MLGGALVSSIVLHPLRLAIKLDGDAVAFGPRLRVIATDVDPAATIADVGPLSHVLSLDSEFWMWFRRVWAILVGILIALSVSGVYALMSFTVAGRTREIGIRTALGAQRSRIVSMVARRSFVQLGVGTLLGIPCAAWVLANGEFDNLGGYAPTTLAILVGVTVFVGIGVPACLVPTLRALRIMPTEALRGGG